MFLHHSGYFCNIPLSHSEPDIGNQHHPLRKQGRKARKDKEFWAIIRNKYPELPEPVKLDLFYKPPKLNPKCKFCGEHDVKLSWVVADDVDRLKGYTACYLCGARGYVGYLPSPKVIALLISELYLKGFSVPAITKSLNHEGLNISKPTVIKIIETMGVKMTQEELTSEIIKRLYKRILKEL